MTRTTEYLQTNFPSQTFNLGVVFFSDPSQYHQAFETVITRLSLDLVGRFVRRYKFQGQPTITLSFCLGAHDRWFRYPLILFLRLG